MNKHAGLFTLFLSFVLFSVQYSYSQPTKDYIYVGEKVCRQCHHKNGNRNQFIQWRTSKHALAYATLAKPEAKQIAELSGIDTNPQKSPICLGCHTTAYNVEEWERDDSFHFEDGVQCELCHGRGSEYADEKIMQDRSKALQAGLILLSEKNCMVCHKEKASHVTVLNSKKFDYQQALKDISHLGREGKLHTNNEIPSTASSDSAYVGSFICSACHGKDSHNNVFSKWRLSNHAQAYILLSSEKAFEIANQMAVFNNPRYEKKCLACHTTGKLEPNVQFAGSFDPAQGVQCESCHGFGGKHVEAMQQNIESSSTNFPKVTEQTCVKCHADGIHGKTFDYHEMLPKVSHTEWQEEQTKIEYKTPFNLAVSNDGSTLFVVCEASNSLIVLDSKTGKIKHEIRIGVQPHFAALSPDEQLVYVSNRASDDVSVIDTQNYQIISSIKVGDEPHEIAITRDGKKMYVANAGTYDVSVVDLQKRSEVKRLAASRGPWGTAISADGKFVYISNNLPRFDKFRTTPKSEVTVISTKNSTVAYRYTLNDANLIQGIAVSPDNEFVLTTLIRTKNLVPMTRNVQGWIMTNGIGILWPDGRVDQLLLDEVNDFFADPTDVVFSKDGKYAFVSGGGVQEIAMIDLAKMKQIIKNVSEEEKENALSNHLGLSTEFVIKRIPVGQSPRGMVISPDNQLLYVADGLEDAISVIDIHKRKRTRVIDLGGPKEITQARYGERIFHSAQHTFVRQFSCHSCHPDGHIDGITYDIEPDGLGINPVDNRTLRGINDTAPFKWTGKNPTLKRQCGPRLAAFFTRIDPFTPEQSAALDRYITTIPRPPNRYRTGDELTPAQRRGKRIFERKYDNSGNEIPLMNRCYSCHTPPYYTNREIVDVGSASHLDTNSKFDIPHLNNIYDSPPYLHDGRAQSLEEIWTIYNPKDTHGLTNDLTKDQLNDLIEYLKTL